MSWKDDLIAQGKANENLLRVMGGQLALNAKRLTELKAVIDQSERTRSRSADRMADRLIEMAMVQGGNSPVAASHRRSLEENPVKDDDWGKPEEDQWPPPGCDVVEMP